MWISRNDTSSSEGPVGFSSSSTFFNPLTQGIGSLANNGHIPAGASNNPTGVDTAVQFVFPETEGVRTVSNFVRAATGVKGSFSTPVLGDWDWQASYTHSQDVVSSTYSNVLGVSQLNNILQNGAFNFNNPALTPNGLDGLFQQATTQGISKLDTVDLTASTPDLFKLPTGDVGFGVGAQFLHESEFINGVTNDVIPDQVQNVNGERNVFAGYYEFNIPIIKNLTFDQSGRYDHYSDFGGAFSPNFALRFQPVQAFTAYASYSRGFRAPTLVENSQSKMFSAQTASDPVQPDQSGRCDQHYRDHQRQPRVAAGAHEELQRRFRVVPDVDDGLRLRLVSREHQRRDRHPRARACRR